MDFMSIIEEDAVRYGELYNAVNEIMNRYIDLKMQFSQSHNSPLMVMTSSSNLLTVIESDLLTLEVLSVAQGIEHCMNLLIDVRAKLQSKAALLMN